MYNNFWPGQRPECIEVREEKITNTIIPRETTPTIYE